VGELVGMLNTNATTMIAAAGYDVVSVEAAGEIGKWPIIVGPSCRPT
jgi:hypothetical protein